MDLTGSGFMEGRPFHPPPPPPTHPPPPPGYLMSKKPRLVRVNKIAKNNKSAKNKKINVYNKDSELYNYCLRICFDEHCVLSDDKRKK